MAVLMKRNQYREQNYQVTTETAHLQISEIPKHNSNLRHINKLSNPNIPTVLTCFHII